jgi:hypothetical protein
MAEPNLFKIFTARLNKIGIRYMVTGAVAVVIYGEPRLTHDIDLVIELKMDEVKKIEETFSSEEFYPGSRKPPPLAVDKCANFWPGCRPARASVSCHGLYL